jgi:NAD-dependent dihydropyrimidine dehydrogenase PreA subunit
MGVKMQMRRSRGKMRPNSTGMRGRRADYAQRSGKKFFNGMMTKGMGFTPLSYPSLRSSSPEPTRTTRSREQELQSLRRKVHAVKAELRSLERRTGILTGETTVSDFQVFVDSDRCVGCGICRDVCPAGAISIEEIALVDSERCTGCRFCLDQCPMGALSFVPLKTGY